MQSIFVTILLNVLMLAGFSSAKPPAAPGLTYLYTVNITGSDGIDIGPGPRGQRTVFPIVRGAFAGPRLKGKVLPIGGDWALADANHPNGTLTIDVRQTFETDDGAHVQVFETGSTQPDGSAHVRLTYETGSEKYYWMNSIVAIGIIRSAAGGGITIDTWQMTVSK